MDKEVIQSVGFRNTVENGEVTGFQFKVRLPYYRGVFLSQIMSGTIEVDGEKFDKDATIWNVKGEDFTVEEMKNDWHTHWDLNKPATIKVKKPGGLSEGYHDIAFGFCYTSSYMPPFLQDNLDPDHDPVVVFPEFGGHKKTRRLILVR